MVRSLAAALAVFVALQAGAAATERAITAYVDAHHAEALALLERVVNINSGTQNFAGVREVGAIFRASLDALGFRTRWVDGAAFQRAGHLVAEHRGQGPKLLLIGHLDSCNKRLTPQPWPASASTCSSSGTISMPGRISIGSSNVEPMARCGRAPGGV